MIRSIACAAFSMALAFPAFASGAAFPAEFPVQRSLNLKVSVHIGGQPVKSPVTLAAGSEFSIIWESDALGCVSNWSEEALQPSASAVGSISASRSFVITCYGRGAAKTARLQVNVGSTDLAVPSFSVSNLRKAKSRRAYYADAHILKANLKNMGKLPASTPFRVQFEMSADGQTNWIALGDYGVASFPGSAGKPLTHEWHSNAGEKVFLRVCADKTEKVVEAKEDNNCSKVLGPYTFEAKPAQ